MYDVTIRLENVGYSIGQHHLFGKLTASVPPGHLLNVIGANGSGKTSLLRLLAGLTRPDKGYISYINAPDEEACHYLAHQSALKQSLSVCENITFWHQFGGVAGDTPVTAAAKLDLSRLWYLPVHALSAGQKRRVGLARLLVTQRPVWLWDEATTALDHAATARMAEIAQQHLDQGGILIAATHTHILPNLPDKQRITLAMETFHLPTFIKGEV